MAECKEKFKQFILRFIDPNAESDERTDDMNLNEPLYLQKLEEVRKSQYLEELGVTEQKPIFLYYPTEIGHVMSSGVKF